jgi:phosphatidylinositol alpha-mannosyltransferase
VHVIHIAANPPFVEGIGTLCYYNARALRELGCDVQVYASRTGLHVDESSLPHYHFMDSWLSIGQAYLTPDLLSLPRADIWHLHFPFMLGSELLMLRALRLQVPIVVSYHSDLQAGGVRRPIFWVYNRTITPLLLHHARAICVLSHDYAESCFFGKSVFRRRRTDLREIPSAVDAEIYRPDVDPSPVYAKHGLQPGDRIVLFVSSLDRSHARKGLGLLLEAMAHLPENLGRLVVVGDGDMRLEYETLARELGIAQRTIFAGRASAELLPAYYAAASVVAVPSLPPEAFGQVLAEGMAAGRPVIGSNIPGVRLVVRDQETGFLIPPGDRDALVMRLRQLLDSSELRRQLGANARGWVKRTYTWPAVGDRLLKVYQEVLKPG